MKAFKYILFLLLISFVGSAIYVAVQPNSFKIEKNQTIHAPIEIVYHEIINFKSWNTNYGKASLKTIQSSNNVTVKKIVEFENFPTTEITWNLKKNIDGSIAVNCVVSANYFPFGFKLKNVLYGSMEPEISENLKTELEKLERAVIEGMKAYKITINDIIFHDGGYYVYNTTTCNTADLRSKINDEIPKLAELIKNDTITLAGKPFVIYNKRDRQRKTVNFSYCIPTTEQIIAKDSTFLTGELEAFSALKVTLKGDLKNIEEARKAANTYLKKKNLNDYKTGFEMEIYVTDPSKIVNPADLITEIYIGID